MPYTFITCHVSQLDGQKLHLRTPYYTHARGKHQRILMRQISLIKKWAQRYGIAEGISSLGAGTKIGLRFASMSIWDIQHVNGS